MVVVDLPYPRKDSLKSRELLIDTISFSTRSLIDDYYLWITANPIINNDKDQAEQFYFNNLAQTKISVTKG